MALVSAGILTGEESWKSHSAHASLPVAERSMVVFSELNRVEVQLMPNGQVY
jgi:hypothetical protein